MLKTHKSEVQPQSKLQLPWICDSGDCVVSGGSDGGSWQIEVWVIEDVEKLGTELEIEPFRQGEVT